MPELSRRQKAIIANFLQVSLTCNIPVEPSFNPC